MHQLSFLFTYSQIKPTLEVSGNLAAGWVRGLFVFKQVVSGVRAFNIKAAANSTGNEVFLARSHSREKRVSTSCPTWPQSTLTPRHCSGLACGRCRMKYAPGDRITVLLSRIKISPWRSAVLARVHISSRRAAVMPIANIVLEISCTSSFLKFFSYAEARA
jgi:hypothetical protein